MGGLKSWLDWAVLALCTLAALIAVLFGARALDLSAPAQVAHARPALGALAVIAALTAVNCGLLLGAAVCKARRDIRLGRR